MIQAPLRTADRDVVLPAASHHGCHSHQVAERSDKDE